MILFLHVLLLLFIYLFIFFFFFLVKSSNSDFLCDYLYMIHTICKYFDLWVYIFKNNSKNKCLVKVKELAVCLLG